ncbi:MAG TPA: response regulator [Geobacteraceae bacterium]|nr:response regulator [Geobacteraceae bacterium]
MGTGRDKGAPASFLIVEDDKDALEILCRMIHSKFPGIEVYRAENGKEGVQAFREHLPEVVITDINMPVMDGIEMAGIIKSIRPETRFIVLTAYTNRVYLEKFIDIGFSAYILKPVVFGKLFDAIENCLAEHGDHPADS